MPVKAQQKTAHVATQEILDEEEKGFEVIEDTANIQKKKQQKGPWVPQNNYRGRGAPRGGAGGRGGHFVPGGRGGNRPWHTRNQGDVTGYIHQLGKKGFRESSIDVKGDWPVIIELSKNQLEKLNPVTPTLVATAAQCGDVFQYNHELDKSGTHKQIPLLEFTGTVYQNVPTLEDSVIKRLAYEKKADIFATELAVSAIMTAPKSLYSWDVVIKKHQDMIFIDKRDEPNMLDNLTVNETSSENQPIDDDSVNGVRKIMEEAMKVQNQFMH